ncbi:MAG: alpha/beta hydrolase, partial [Aquificae bacterium]|nr:alpha/beta hydrolase [Aquificota bacterium]
ELTFRKDWAVDVIRNDYEIIKDGRVDFPKNSPVEIVIMHGTKDQIVPVSLSELFVREVNVKKFLKVEDDHRLSETFEKYIGELII